MFIEVSMWSSLGFQDSCSFFMEQLLFFHDHSMLVLIVVRSVVLYYLFGLLYCFYFDRFVVEGHEVEFI
jgi:cytochrome c oxidase subunit 2